MAHLVADIPQKALIEHNGKVLIAFDAVEKVWELPGGRIEEGEEGDLASALKREVREELGVEISVGKLLDAFVFIGTKPHCVFTYLCHLVGDPAGIKIDGIEVGEVRWISSAAEVNDLRMLSGYKKIITHYFKK
jgi:8-oxo-dGTP pyrophosphatase MutT (NUDIX family)